MKRIVLVSLVALFSAIMSCSAKKTTETFVLSDKTEIYTFVGNDSLYIDCATSGCGLVAYKLHKVGNNVWKGEYLDYDDIEHPRMRFDNIRLKHISGSNYLIIFNGKEREKLIKVS